MRIQTFLSKSKNKLKNNNLYVSLQTKSNSNLNPKNDIISSDYCFIDNGNNSYIDTLKKYAFIMEKNSIVKPGFFNNILKREQMNSTIIGNGITIPHSQEEFVLSPKICIVKLNNPIIWQDQKIDLILILALKFKDISTTKSFFKNFYSLLDNKDLIEKIKHSHDVEEITSIFLN